MSSGAPTQQQIAAFQQVFDALFDFLRWTYGVGMGTHDRSAIEDRVLKGWAHPDGTVRELLTYLGGLHTTVFGQPAGRRDRYRPEVQRIFARLFAAPDPTERGQVIALLHRTLEQACAGCTGVALPPHPSAPSPASGSPLPATGSPSPASSSGQGLAELPDVQRLTMDAQIRQQRLLLEQKLWDLQHNTAMDIIRSMR